MRKNGVAHLLMGGQACVLYGAAEFSRDTDIAIVADAPNLARLQAALDELRAERIAVPPFERRYLEMGLAVHFRSRDPEALGMRIDVMSSMRGVDPFADLWARRTTIELGDDQFELLSLPDLVRAKKTQRDRDWPMITRLLEASYFSSGPSPTREQIRFWLRELRTPSLLVELAQREPDATRAMANERSLLAFAHEDRLEELQLALTREERHERDEDRRYWAPLEAELERLRRARV